MAEENISDGWKFSQSLQGTGNLESLFFQNAFPGIFILTCHIVGSMVTGYDHERCQMYVGRMNGS